MDSLAFLTTDPPRLPWLSSNCKTQPHTKQATPRLTGEHLLFSAARGARGSALKLEMLLRLGQMAARGDNIERFLMGRQVF